MSKNIKEIGKELLGKSLNSFHRKTGLTQLEKNNKMQDGILDGILSQVDDAYIEKTEQSNVIHLDGSGDGVVVLDSIEGNTMVNLCGRMNSGDTQWILNNGWWELNKEGVLFLDFEVTVKPSTLYTVIMNTKLDNSGGIVFGFRKDNLGWNSDAYSTELNGVNKFKFTTSSEETNRFTLHRGITVGETTTIGVKDIMILEGDWTNKEIPASYFTGLQSSFEEKVNDEGKYEIEILSNNENLFEFKKDVFDLRNGVTWTNENSYIKLTGATNTYPHLLGVTPIKLKPNTDYTFFIDGYGNGNYRGINIGTTTNQDNGDLGKTTLPNTRSIVICNFRTDDKGLVYVHMYLSTPQDTIPTNYIYSCGIVQGKKNVTQIKKQKQNKIKLLINEPLRSVHSVKDRLCIKDGKLVVERNVFGKVFDGTENVWLSCLTDSTINVGYEVSSVLTEGSLILHKCDRLPNITHYQWDKPTIGTHCKKTNIFFNIPLNWLGGNTINDVKQYLVNQYNQGTPMKIVHILNEPIYEEVLNEYGEPIILEGYENGTIYIDSTIVSTTTVRYTPKMESFKTLNEVSDNNTMLANDINDNIIPYMMDVDLMIMEKEMALMSHKNIRKMEALDMTSMQKRTQDMLERLIKGKTLTEQECKTRVTTYLNAGKITDAQAEELNFLIDEIYA